MHCKLYGNDGLECPKCHKWLFIPISEEAARTVKAENDVGDSLSLVQPSFFRYVDSYTTYDTRWPEKVCAKLAWDS